MAERPVPDRQSKSSVGYGRGMADAHCGICRHYLARGACTLVVGRITRTSWCKLFAREPQS